MTRFSKWSWIRRNTKYVAKSFSCYEIGGTEWYALVVPKRFGWTENNKSVKPSLSKRKDLSPQLTRLVRSHKDLQGIGCRINIKEKQIQMKFFLRKGKQICMRQMQEHGKEHERTSSRIGRRQSHLCQSILTQESSEIT